MLKRGAFSSNKGMSPLIATVLLIAFAVALGAMIMNWSSTLFEPGGPDCSKIKFSNPVVCFANNLIHVDLLNAGDGIEALSVEVNDENLKFDVDVKQGKLSSNQPLSVKIPFVKTAKTYEGFVPSVMDAGKATPCSTPVLEVEDLPNCSI